MKVLVIGGSGVIGFQILQKFSKVGYDVYCTYNKNKFSYSNAYYADIRDKNSISNLIKKVNPDIVIHTTSITNVDLCETDNKQAKLVNVEGTSNIIEGCKSINCKLVYVSTSFVFNGNKSKYFENDPTSPSTFYGITKNEGENLVKNSGLEFLILRTDHPYYWKQSWQHTNSVLRAIDIIKSGNVLNEIVDWYNKPTYVPDFVSSLLELLKINETGIYHVVGSDFIDRYNFSLKVAEIFGLRKDLIKPIYSETLKLPAKRVNVNLDNKKLIKKIGMNMMGIEDRLKAMLESKNN